MAVTKEEISKMAKEVSNTPDIDYGQAKKVVLGKTEKYPLATLWNEFVKKMEGARDIWTKLQEEIDVIGEKELEIRYPVIAQRHLGRFRKVKFEWMASMFVDYYRGAGGLDAMYIILPPEEKEKKDGDRD